MAIAAAMSQNDDKDNHDHDMVMPGFRFHPTEEELIEFYLRRKVEGKRFNVELITFLDLYRYDPWELPALASIGEKEWFFYVPRDRKYRNGDRPNRVTTSGYWKATGADRMIRTENLRSIGLKKTLVFYSGKAPKGIRTSWIMNEYRLPQHDTDRYQKAEISLCRVYKRPGVEDHSRLPGSHSSAPSSSRGTHSDKIQHNLVSNGSASFQPFDNNSSASEIEKLNEADASSSTDTGTALGLANIGAISPMTSTLAPASVEEVGGAFSQYSRQIIQPPTCTGTLFTYPPMPTADDLRRLVDYQHAYVQQQQQHFNQQNLTQILPSSSHSQSLVLNTLPNTITNFSDKLWEWNPIPDSHRDYTGPFK
ncbi:hypothetical protein IFM89_039621 [Coptis chinensis]|uniref:NAC domain-containing protein n=1 Tax=Coptis chinensis TaxID=261450 RepID=A0A835GUU9_9MAGN|nr:hypothetical protein IFM89_039621 [Coptis chinensis]